MDREKYAEKLLDRLHDAISQNYETSNKIRNWCVTIWMATLMIVSTDKLSVTVQQGYILTFLPIVMFWLLDGFHNVFILIHSKRAKIIENIIAEGNYEDINKGDYFFFVGYDKIPMMRKISVFLYSLFCRESVTSFYIMLGIGTIAFIYFGANNA